MIDLFFKKNVCFVFFFFLFLYVPLFSAEENSLESLQYRVDADLAFLKIPAHRWILHPSHSEAVLDVAIIGGGMGGMAVAFGLIKEGVCHVEIFDENPKGKEGPWETSARMRYLRSDKTAIGPAMGIPSLTFQSWYRALHGETAWNQLDLVPTADWAAYLRWYREATHLPIKNEMTLQEIRPAAGCLELIFDCLGSSMIVRAYKVVLASGRQGFGGGELPGYALELPKNVYAHTTERIDPTFFFGKKIAVIGAGASAFDAAATALEEGAEKVHMLIRRSEIPVVNRFAKFAFSGILNGFHTLSDEMKIQFFEAAFCCGIPPSKSSVERLCGYENMHLHFSTQVEAVNLKDDALVLNTTQGDIAADFIIFATGYEVEGTKRPELRHFINSILLCEDQFSKELLSKQPKLGRFPYLGSHFQFKEKIEGIAPELKNIYCFNYGAYLSHGLVSGDIPGISIGATRLVEGIVSDLFVERSEHYLHSIQNYTTPLFDPEDYEIFN